MDSETRRRGIHVGIIPDGSRRWAKKSGIASFDGAQSGIAMDRIVRHIFGSYPEVGELSIWALSTDNMKRPEEDKRLVYGLLGAKILDLSRDPMLGEKGIKVNVVGSRLREMPEDIKALVDGIVSKTKDNKERTLNICIGYGGKQEILDAVMASTRWLRKNPAIERLHESVFEDFLQIPRPLDLVVRTGGEKRLSGFMLYQIEYAELFFSDTLWPDFTPAELDNIMADFGRRQRRFGI